MFFKYKYKPLYKVYVNAKKIYDLLKKNSIMNIRS